MNVIGLLGVLLSIALLIFLAYRRWNVIIISVVAAAVVGITNHFNILDMFSKTYLPGAASFMQSWFLVFTLGALYTELMSYTGAVASISYKLVDVFGKKNLIFVACLIPVILTYGGINPYVQIFIVWPMYIIFSREANIPRSIWISVFYVGLFAGGAMPGAPGNANVLTTTALGVSSASAALYNLFVTGLFFAIGYICVYLTSKKLQKKGLGYVETERDKGMSTAVRENCPPFLISIIPMLVTVVLYIGLTSGWFGITISGIYACYVSVFMASVSCVLLNVKKLKGNLKNILLKGSVGGINPVMTAAVITGYVAVISASPTYASFVKAILGMQVSPYFQLVFSSSIIAFITGAANVAVLTVWNNFGSAWLAAGLTPEVIRPLLLNSVMGISLCPHSGGLHGVMDFAGTDLKESYGITLYSILLNGFVTCMIGALVAMLIF